MRRLEVRFRRAALDNLDEIYRHAYRISLDPEIAFRLVERDCVRIVNVFYGGRDFEALYRGRLDRDD